LWGLDVKVNSQIPKYSCHSVKDALKASAELFQDLPLPSDAEFLNLEDLVAVLHTVEILTLKLCQANFNILKVPVPLLVIITYQRGKYVENIFER
jgi:hypothetical protein